MKILVYISIISEIFDVVEVISLLLISEIPTEKGSTFQTPEHDGANGELNKAIMGQYTTWSINLQHEFCSYSIITFFENENLFAAWV